MDMMSIDKKKAIIVSALCILLAMFCVGGVIAFMVHDTVPADITIEPLRFYQQTPQTTHRLTKEEFKVLRSEGTISYATYEQYIASTSTGSSLTAEARMVNLDGANGIIYEMVDEYFQVYYGYSRVSPILPMAISNVETPGRADHSVTWSSLFPTRYISIEEINTFDVTQVIRSPELYKALSTEYSTRDRGCLQMSPTYGTGNNSINARMSGTEKDKLAHMDTSQYSVWVSGASSYPGDRFYLPDVLLRMQAAMQQQVSNILINDYPPTNDLQLIAMLAMSHQSSGIWGSSNHNKSIGLWRSGQKAYEWSEVITSSSMVDALTMYAATHDVCYIDTTVANQIYKSVCDKAYDDYATSSQVCTYPIKALYAYIKLCQLYMQ